MRLTLRKKLAVGLLVILCSSVLAAQSKNTSQVSSDLDRYISKLYESFYPESVAPGFAVVVVKDSHVILLKGYGYADVESKRRVTPQTAFYIASSIVCLIRRRGICHQR